MLGGAAAVAWLFCRVHKRAFAPIADVLSAGAALGLVFMRVGCILNGCCFGMPTGSGWGLVFRDPASRVPRELLGVALHPVQLYEAAGAGLILLVLHLTVLPRIRRGALRPGSAFLVCAALYGALRFVEDFWRASDPGLVLLAGLTTAQLFSLLCLAGAAAGIIKNR